jgi:hypothetical protein
MTTEHYVATLEERVLDLLYDGDEWYSSLLARTLGTTTWRVNKALSALLRSGEIHVAKVGGRQGRVRTFKHGPAPCDGLTLHTHVKRRKAAATSWHAADPVVAAAFRNMAIGH